MAKEKICGIYCIENMVDGKKYIGLSRDIDKRFKSHKNMLRSKSHINEHFQSAWDKYGEAAFSFYIIEICEQSELQPKEICYIEKFQTRNNAFGYNRTSGGDGVKDYTGEISEKMSKKITKNAVCQFDLEGNLIKTHRNCKFASEECGANKENIRLACNKAKGRKTLSGFIWMYKKDYLENGINLDDYKKVGACKKIIQTDLNGNYIATFNSAREAWKATGIGYKLISRVCKGERYHTHNYVFRFEKDEN